MGIELSRLELVLGKVWRLLWHRLLSQLALEWVCFPPDLDQGSSRVPLLVRLGRLEQMESDLFPGRENYLALVLSKGRGTGKHLAMGL